MKRSTKRPARKNAIPEGLAHAVVNGIADSYLRWNNADEEARWAPPGFPTCILMLYTLYAVARRMLYAKCGSFMQCCCMVDVRDAVAAFEPHLNRRSLVTILQLLLARAELVRACEQYHPLLCDQK